MPRPRPLSASAQQSWARVRIALNLRDIPAATVHARDASSVTDWDRLTPTLTWGAGTIHPLAEIPTGWCWLEPASYRLLVSKVVLDEFGLSNSLAQFADVIERMSESDFRSFDPQNWRELDRLGF